MHNGSLRKTADHLVLVKKSVETNRSIKLPEARFTGKTWFAHKKHKVSPFGMFGCSNRIWALLRTVLPGGKYEVERRLPFQRSNSGSWNVDCNKSVLTTYICSVLSNKLTFMNRNRITLSFKVMFESKHAICKQNSLLISEKKFKLLQDTMNRFCNLLNQMN